MHSNCLLVCAIKERVPLLAVNAVPGNCDALMQQLSELENADQSVELLAQQAELKAKAREAKAARLLQKGYLAGIHNF